ncbi:hypothetical protein LMG29542_08706 [Paraburkholderia humisilvae]|uniref:Uncharacterized protein n=1 Tax=Paraburkholderia humisilvae TaxID=627669 RepID=A0A6J5FA22_9BURK|nr:hypothetical protein LMG29542_08706 [Paraburkholderia humisilvae]
MQGVEPVLVLCLLRQDPLRASNQILKVHTIFFGYRVDLTLHVTHHPTHTRAQRTQCLLHASVLLRMGEAANLTRQVWCLAVVVLPQFQAVARCCLHQMFATPLRQT